jgi:translation initiation factor IF-2
MAMNVELTPEAFLIAKDNQLQVKTTKIIYELLDDLQHIIDDYNNVGKMQYEQKGQARVKMIYNVKTKLGYMNIAGCSV